MSHFFLGNFISCLPANLDRYEAGLSLNSRRLFMNLLQSPRSFGWFFGATHFYWHLIDYHFKDFR
jgi:hypothetical protein